VRSIAQPPDLAAMIGNSRLTAQIVYEPISTAGSVGKMKNIRRKRGFNAIFAVCSAARKSRLVRSFSV
jgi:hypothetical protein